MEKLDFLPIHGSQSTFSGENKSRTKEMMNESIITEEQDEDDDEYYLYDEDPPPYDITEKLKEINTALAKEIIPDGYEERNRKVIFRENPVDFEIPPTPNYSSEEEDDGYGDSTETSDDLIDETNSEAKSSNPKLKINPGYVHESDPTANELLDLDLAQFLSMQNAGTGSGPTTPNSVADEINFLFKCFSKLSVQNNFSQTFPNQNDITVPDSLRINDEEPFIHETDIPNDAQYENLPHSAHFRNENNTEKRGLNEIPENSVLENFQSSTDSDNSINSIVAQSEAREIQQNSDDGNEIHPSLGLNNNTEASITTALQSETEISLKNEVNLENKEKFNLEEHKSYLDIPTVEENVHSDSEEIQENALNMKSSKKLNLEENSNYSGIPTFEETAQPDSEEIQENYVNLDINEKLNLEENSKYSDIPIAEENALSDDEEIQKNDVNLKIYKKFRLKENSDYADLLHTEEYKNPNSEDIQKNPENSKIEEKFSLKDNSNHSDIPTAEENVQSDSQEAPENELSLENNENISLEVSVPIVEIKDEEGQFESSEIEEFQKNNPSVSKFNGNLYSEVKKPVMPLLAESPKPIIISKPLKKLGDNSSSQKLGLLKWKRAMRQLHNVRQTKSYVETNLEPVNVPKSSQGTIPGEAFSSKGKIQTKKRLLPTRPSTSSLAILKEKSSMANFEETMVMASRGKFRMMTTEDFQSSKMAGSEKNKATKSARGPLRPFDTIQRKFDNNTKNANSIPSMNKDKFARNKTSPLNMPISAKSRPQSVNWPKEELQRKARGSSGSTFRLTPEQKAEKERKLQAIVREHQQKLEKAKQEKLKRRLEVEEAYRDWLQCKKLQEPNLKKSTNEISIKRKVNMLRAEPAVGGPAFQDWLQKKKIQKLEEMRISELKKKMEERTLSIRKQEDNEIAFRKWLQKKSRDSVSALPMRRKSSSTNHQLAHVAKWRTENFL